MTEFQPGVPWKGIQNSGDPESDPYMTPGSVLGSPGSPSLNDSDHQLLRDNIGIWSFDEHRCWFWLWYYDLYYKNSASVPNKAQNRLQGLRVLMISHFENEHESEILTNLLYH